VLRTFLVNSKYKVVYPTDYSSLYTDTADFRRLFRSKDNIIIKNYEKAHEHFFRVFIRMENLKACKSCHSPARRNLGMIVLDVSNHETEEIVQMTQKFSVIYTILILVAIFLLVVYLHYKYIRTSIRQFRNTINQINKGRLDARLAIPGVRELGALGANFNEMLETLERTQQELQFYHEKELKSNQKLATIGEMSARIAHEIRNPITGISRALEVIMSGAKDDENKPVLEEIQRQTNRVNEAITNLLRYSRSKDLNPTSGNVNEVIRSLVFFLQNQAHEKPVTFTTDLQELLPDTVFDHEMIENVLMNLSFNAIQALPDEGGSLVFKSVFNSGQYYLLVSVRDNGIGIPDEIAGEIFKPFYTTRTKGTGLGLAIAKDILEKHGGELWFENNVDSGCTFFLKIPLR